MLSPKIPISPSENSNPRREYANLTRGYPVLSHEKSNLTRENSKRAREKSNLTQEKPYLIKEKSDLAQKIAISMRGIRLLS
jgi:hypothetical protein